MAAYALIGSTITDSAAMQNFLAQVPATLEPFDGEFLVQSGPSDVVEGDWLPMRVAVIAFPDLAQARGWYDSPGYQAILPLRQAAKDNHFFVLFDGV